MRFSLTTRASSLLACRDCCPLSSSPRRHSCVPERQRSTRPPYGGFPPHCTRRTAVRMGPRLAGGCKRAARALHRCAPSGRRGRLSAAPCLFGERVTSPRRLVFISHARPEDHALRPRESFQSGWPRGSTLPLGWIGPNEKVGIGSGGVQIH